MATSEQESSLHGRLRWVRVSRLGLSLADMVAAVAEATGASYTAASASRWEKGERIPPVDYVAGVAAVSALNGHWILLGEGSPDTLPGAAEKVLDLIRDLVSPRAGVVDERMYDRMSVIAEQIARDRAALERESA